MQTTVKSYTDRFGRTITPINPQPGNPIPVLADPMFDTQTDHWMEVMAGGGIDWHVMTDGDGARLLAFEFLDQVTIDALDAAQRLKRRFAVDAKLRDDMNDFAVSVGRAFHEFAAAGEVQRALS